MQTPDVTDREAVIAALRRAAPEVFAPQPEIRLAYLYGSVARGQAMPWSDVDVAVVLARPLPPLERLWFELDLELALIDATGLREVEVRALNTAPLLVQGAVVTEGVLLFVRDEAFRVHFEASMRSRYFDYLPAARAMAATFAAALKERLEKTPPPPSGEWPV